MDERTPIDLALSCARIYLEAAAGWRREAARYPGKRSVRHIAEARHCLDVSRGFRLHAERLAHD